MNSWILLVLCCTLGSQQSNNNVIECSDAACQGTYTGAEFVNGDDVAHQFSNKMSELVGKKLKALYGTGQYAKVDFERLKMTTKGMGSGSVQYYLYVPFTQVNKPCDAFTSFDHVGGWNHRPALEERKKQLSKALMRHHTLDISSLQTTPEGLQEYWIQWKNKKTQAMYE